MFELLPIFLLTLIFAFMCHSLSVYNFDMQKYEKKDKLFLIIIIIVWVLFAGLRVGYNDTLVYTWKYDYEVKPFSKEYMDGFDWSLGSNPGFQIAMSIMKTIGFDAQTFILVFTLLTYAIYCWFIHKYTNNICFSFFLMFTFSGFTFPMAAIKQCAAMALSLLAVDRLLCKKRVAFVLWILLAITFHPYALMYLICPLLFFVPWTKKTWYMIGAFGIAGLSLQLLLGRIIDVTTMLGEAYTTESFSGEGVNPFRVAVCFVPLLLSFVLRKKIDFTNCSKEDALFMNLTMLNAEIMFVGLFGTANYFGRLANYFSLFTNVSLPWLMKYIDKKYRFIIYVLAVIGYLGFFWYGNARAGGDLGNFDSQFRRITLWEYLKSINAM